MARLCASVKEHSRQCWTRLSASLNALGIWNRYRASANASAKHMQDSVGRLHSLTLASFTGVHSTAVLTPMLCSLVRLVTERVNG